MSSGGGKKHQHLQLESTLKSLLEKNNCSKSSNAKKSKNIYSKATGVKINDELLTWCLQCLMKADGIVNLKGDMGCTVLFQGFCNIVQQTYYIKIMKLNNFFFTGH